MPWTSIPRAAMFVATRMRCRPARKLSRAATRCFCERSEWMRATLCRPRSSTRHSHSASDRRLVKTRVEPGTESSSARAQLFLSFSSTR